MLLHRVHESIPSLSSPIVHDRPIPSLLQLVAVGPVTFCHTRLSASVASVSLASPESGSVEAVACRIGLTPSVLVSSIAEAGSVERKEVP